MIISIGIWHPEDISGVSGVGRVAVGVVFPSGKVVLEWMGTDSTFEIFEKLRHVVRIHGHSGKTGVVFVGDALRCVCHPQAASDDGPIFSTVAKLVEMRDKAASTPSWVSQLQPPH
jgi:hypothetical protein